MFFEEGKYYTLVTCAGKDKVDTTSPSECIDISALPLVTFRTVFMDGRAPREFTVNTASTAFVRADLVPTPTPPPPEKPRVWIKGKL
jgi:hypothetical protein